MKNRTLPAAARLIIALSFPLFAILSCGEQEVFTEYEGVNLITSMDFSEEDTWFVDYGTPVDFDYMSFEEAGSVSTPGTDGPAAGAAAYRLEIVNLMPNGDFEEDTAADWVFKDTDDPVDNNGSTVSISSSRLNFEIGNNSDRFDYDLSGLLDGLAENANYVIRFSVVNTSTLAMMIHPGESPASVFWTIPANLTSASFPLENLFPEFTITDTENPNYLSLGDFDGEYQSSVIDTGRIDNLRITRVDIQHYLYADLPYNFVSEDGLSLVHGTYRFSVFVKNDSAVTPAVKNRFPAALVTVGLSGLSENALGEIVPSTINYEIYSPDDEGVDWGSWTKLSADLLLQPEEPEDPSRAIARLFVFPSSFDRQDVGSVLISTPSLEFLPDGE